ncbi:hypothetical protein [Pseudogemmobacter faecipullorum]|uniref:Uncharacterized protein n=1 Tax=Pseudogemmobacter faecipullorum TaxID=2755041 RepID=A0ABS8CH31_9RHOB|nr:hypothetical protein [Pseudogemmobacter faecipullorum]MCB5408683.1 hypothetical protein [Pseudogemmobacter faecipullorum]
MRRILLATALALLPGLALADPLDLSRQIGAQGLATTGAGLAAVASPAADQQFALAGIRFLGAVERALQLRWQVGLEADWTELPVLRLPIPANPEAREIRGADITALLGGIIADMEGARQALPAEGADFALEIDLADLWFDINASGGRDAGEDLVTVAGLALGFGGSWQPKPGELVIRFDSADAAWLEAYTHLLAGLATTIQAYDPGPATDRIVNASKEIYALWGESQPDNAWDMLFGKQVDRLTILLRAMEQKPDPALAKAAHDHFLKMISANRRFWPLVLAESDNDREWVPNEAQVSALGIALPEGTVAHWQAVLTEAEQVLNGALLIPHWRYGAEAGINLKKLFDDAPAIDLIGMIQGEALLPYAEKGPLMSGQAWSEFERMMQGDALMIAVFFN